VGSDPSLVSTPTSAHRAIGTGQVNSGVRCVAEIAVDISTEVVSDPETGSGTNGNLTFPDLPRLELDQLLTQLVDRAGEAELLMFATASEKSLERFKDELWALDEYAGIRYRDPSDGGHTLLDISLQPNLRPLRRLLAAHLRSGGPSSLSDLRGWTLHETIYRTEDATRAVQSMVAAHEAERAPSTGRLSPTTVIAAAA